MTMLSEEIRNTLAEIDAHIARRTLTEKSLRRAQGVLRDVADRVEIIEGLIAPPEVTLSRPIAGSNVTYLDPFRRNRAAPARRGRGGDDAS